MTTLMVWISYSNTGERSNLPRSIYLASDSRITWGSESRRWDAGRKSFAPVKEPHLFGYCGDVVFPSLVLGQLVSAIDQGILFHHGASGAERNTSVLASLQTSHGRRHNVAEHDFQIVHVYRSHDWPSTEFLCWKIGFTAKNGRWDCSELPLPMKTGVVLSLGSARGRLSPTLLAGKIRTPEEQAEQFSLHSVKLSSLEMISSRVACRKYRVCILMAPRARSDSWKKEDHCFFTVSRSSRAPSQRTLNGATAFSRGSIR
jgi:hypothetical protein